jgi:parallel beta-helix repeat protein
VRGTLIADGNDSSATWFTPIVFTSINDHSVGGATGNGNPSSRNWDAIAFQATSANSLMRHVIVKYGGCNGCIGGPSDCIGGALWIGTSSVTISNSEFSHNYEGIHIMGVSPKILNSSFLNNDVDGIWMTDFSSPEIKNNIFRSNTFSGISCNNSSLPIVENNTFEENMSFAVHNSTPSIVIMAQNNNWGDSSGPYDPSDDRLSASKT